jgi:hypothetical protein
MTVFTRDRLLSLTRSVLASVFLISDGPIAEKIKKDEEESLYTAE